MFPSPARTTRKGRNQKANLATELVPKSPSSGSTRLGDRSPVVHFPAPWIGSPLFLAPFLYKFKCTAGTVTGLPLHSHSQMGTAASRLHFYGLLVLCASGRKAVPHIQVIFRNCKADKYPMKINIHPFYLNYSLNLSLEFHF